ncbi:hypothetical protein S7S_06130 [Isoalcanivorax pacificus W11-5]|uniref:Uncharacterized protein n=1 Tax=Isoalcanivorax pacificus W11-5 TaxID=391936 RepID=A0A0B4XMT3_9GAMM|nr:hypothetical protein S7S_06130 [Isoalcanivorax pacificus W11-5]
MKHSLRTMLWIVLLGPTQLALSQTVAVTYIHTDHLGSPVMGRTQAGATSFEARYEPFGARQRCRGAQAVLVIRAIMKTRRLV